MNLVLQHAKSLQDLLQKQEIIDDEARGACDRLVKFLQDQLPPPEASKSRKRKIYKKPLVDSEKFKNISVSPPSTLTVISSSTGVASICSRVEEDCSLPQSDVEMKSRRSSRSRVPRIQPSMVENIEASPVNKPVMAEYVKKGRKSNADENTKKETKPTKKLPKQKVIKESDSDIRKIPKTLDQSTMKKGRVLNRTISNASFSSSSTQKWKNAEIRRNLKGETALHSACSSRKYAKVEELLSSGDDPNTKDHAGWTPLHEVVSSCATKIVKLLLEKGAFPDVPGPMNETPLHEAARNNYTEIINLLIKHGADINVRNSMGISPYELANDESRLIMNEALKSQIIPNFTLNSILPDQKTKNILIYPHSLDNSMLMKLNLLSRYFNNVKIADTLNKDVSIVITNCLKSDKCDITYDILNAVIFGIPVISMNWISESSESKLADWENFEIEGLGSSRACIRLSYINTFRMQPKLFNGCHFYFLDLNTPYKINSHLMVSKKLLTKLVTDGDGVILKREPDPERIPDCEKILPYHVARGGALSLCSYFIIYKTKPELAYNMKHIKSLSVEWFIECIKNFQLVDP